jgi:uncharacterized membrane protein YcgQ (UPF0703/DUF1980 family)
MVQERIKQFTGNPAHIEIILNQFLEQSGDDIEVLGFRVLDTETRDHQLLRMCSICCIG